MARIVMKFGGTSMAGIERIRSVAARVRQEAEAGNQVLVVVSAMAGETDRLIQLCKEAAALHDAQEYDVVVASGEQVTAGLLAMTLQNMGVAARSFMGWQLLRATGVHGNARVEAVEVDLGRWVAELTQAHAGLQHVVLARVADRQGGDADLERAEHVVEAGGDDQVHTGDHVHQLREGADDLGGH